MADRWQMILTALSEHDETVPFYHGSITGPIITNEIAERVGAELGPVLSALRAFERRGLVEQRTGSDLQTPVPNWHLGARSWSYCWRLTQVGRDRANWPTAPKRRPSMRQFQDHSEMHAMRSEIMKTLEKVKTMPPGTAEKSVALDMLAVRNRHLIELELKKKIALARNPGRQAAYRATLSQTRERWRREDAISAAELRERQAKFSSH